jgi:hypothetical protein
MKEDDMGGADSTHGRWEIHKIFWFEKLKGGDQLEDLGVDGKIISELI